MKTSTASRSESAARPESPGAGGPLLAATSPGTPSSQAAPAVSAAAIAPQAVPEATAPSAQARRRSPIAWIVAGFVLLTLGAFGFRQWWFHRTHVSTDNAQIEGDVIPLLPKVGGFVAQVRVEENQQVRAGDTLVVLDDRDLAARLAQSEADLAAARAAVGTGSRAGQVEAQLSAARAHVTEASATAWKTRGDRQRYAELAARGIVGRQQRDAAEAAARSADAELRAARDQVAAATAALAGASAKVASSRASRDQAALQLSYTRLLAPGSGVVTKKNVEVGQLVQVGQPLMSVVPLEQVWVVANLKETDVRDVTPDDPVAIRVDAYPGRTFHGRVESLSPASGARFSLLPPDNATGNFTKVVQRIPVRIRLEGQQDPAHVLRPGMSVNVVVTTK